MTSSRWCFNTATTVAVICARRGTSLRASSCTAARPPLPWCTTSACSMMIQRAFVDLTRVDWPRSVLAAGGKGLTPPWIPTQVRALALPRVLPAAARSPQGGVRGLRVCHLLLNSLPNNGLGGARRGSRTHGWGFLSRYGGSLYELRLPVLFRTLSLVRS
jgi:hypothetical protein